MIGSDRARPRRAGGRSPGCPDRRGSERSGWSRSSGPASLTPVVWPRLPASGAGPSRESRPRGADLPTVHGRRRPARRRRRRPQPRADHRLRARAARGASTSTGAACACSCPTPRAAAHCRCCSTPCTARCTVAPRRTTVLVALGTHAPMSPGGAGRPRRLHAGRARPRGRASSCATTSGATPPRSSSLGTIGAARIDELSGGLLHEAVDVRINRAVVEHDVTLVVGPVFPHEVVGFSGGNKYLFPGVSGQEMIDLSHWLGALITSAEIIGTPGHHPGAGADRRGRGAGPGRPPRAVRGHPPGLGRPAARPPSASPATAWAAAAEVSARDPRALPRRPGRPGAVARPRALRRPVDRGQGLLQGRARRRRRRRGGPLRAAHPPGQRHAPGRSRPSATTAATTSWRSGTGSPTCPAATSRTPPTSGAPAATTPTPASPAGCGSRSPPASPRPTCAP